MPEGQRVRFRRAGLGPTLIALIVLVVAVIIIGVVVWMRMERPPGNKVPTQPANPGMVLLYTR